jgi:hypothetical protein
MEYFTTEELTIIHKIKELLIKAPFVKEVTVKEQNEKENAVYNTLSYASNILLELKDESVKTLLFNDYKYILEHEIFFEKDGKVYAYILLKLLDAVETNKLVIDGFPLYRTDSKGTAHRSSSFSKLVDGQLSYIDNLINREKLGLATQREKEIQSNIHKLIKSTKETDLLIMELLNFGFTVGIDIQSIIDDKDVFLAIEKASDFF